MSHDDIIMMAARKSRLFDTDVFVLAVGPQLHKQPTFFLAHVVLQNGKLSERICVVFPGPELIRHRAALQPRTWCTLTNVKRAKLETVQSHTTRSVLKACEATTIQALQTTELVAAPTSLLFYQGTITAVLDATVHVFQLDGQFILLLSYYPDLAQGENYQEIRPGAVVRLDNVHPFSTKKLPSDDNDSQLAGFCACAYSTVSIVCSAPKPMEISLPPPLTHPLSNELVQRWACTFDLPDFWLLIQAASQLSALLGAELLSIPTLHKSMIFERYMKATGIQLRRRHVPRDLHAEFMNHADSGLDCWVCEHRPRTNIDNLVPLQTLASLPLIQAWLDSLPTDRSSCRYFSCVWDNAVDNQLHSRLVGSLQLNAPGRLRLCQMQFSIPLIVLNNGSDSDITPNPETLIKKGLNIIVISKYRIVCEVFGTDKLGWVWRITIAVRLDGFQWVTLHEDLDQIEESRKMPIIKSVVNTLRYSVLTMTQCTTVHLAGRIISIEMREVEELVGVDSERARSSLQRDGHGIGRTNQLLAVSVQDENCIDTILVYVDLRERSSQIGLWPGQKVVFVSLAATRKGQNVFFNTTPQTTISTFDLSPNPAANITAADSCLLLTLHQVMLLPLTSIRVMCTISWVSSLSFSLVCDCGGSLQDDQCEFLCRSRQRRISVSMIVTADDGSAEATLGAKDSIAMELLNLTQAQIKRLQRLLQASAGSAQFKSKSPMQPTKLQSSSSALEEFAEDMAQTSRFFDTKALICVAELRKPFNDWQVTTQPSLIGNQRHDKVFLRVLAISSFCAQNEAARLLSLLH